MTNIVNSTLPTPNNHSEKNKPDGVFVIKQGKTNYKVKCFLSGHGESSCYAAIRPCDCSCR